MSDAQRMALTLHDGTVENIILVGPAFVVPEGCTLVPDDGTAVIGGHWTGATFTPPPAPAPQATATSIEDQLDAELDAIAVSWGYKSSDRLAGYYNSGIAQWQAEARTFVAGRDAWWQKAAAMQAAYKPGDPVPTYESVRAAMPVIARPTPA